MTRVPEIANIFENSKSRRASDTARRFSPTDSGAGPCDCCGLPRVDCGRLSVLECVWCVCIAVPRCLAILWRGSRRGQAGEGCLLCALAATSPLKYLLLLI